MAGLSTSRIAGGFARVKHDYWSARPADATALDGRLWTSAVTSADYGDATQVAYQAAIMDQYKTYVEMADRISARRATANTFFLTFNTAVLTAIGVFVQHPVHGPRGWLALPLLVLITNCVVWMFIVRSYRQLNSGKYAVIGELERRLPAAPYRGEWLAIGEGKDKSRYWPLSHIEQWVPALFAVAYLAGFVFLLVR